MIKNVSEDNQEKNCVLLSVECVEFSTQSRESKRKQTRVKDTGVRRPLVSRFGYDLHARTEVQHTAVRAIQLQSSIFVSDLSHFPLNNITEAEINMWCGTPPHSWTLTRSRPGPDLWAGPVTAQQAVTLIPGWRRSAGNNCGRLYVLEGNWEDAQNIQGETLGDDSVWIDGELNINCAVECIGPYVACCSAGRAG